jgi:protein-disulfide isomerase
MQRLKGMLEVVSTLAVIVAAGALVWMVFVKQPARATAAAPAPAVEDVTGTIGREFMRNVHGTGDIAIVEFSDFQCPFCARHAKDTVPALLKLDGVRYVSMHMPLPMHAQAVAAAEAAECAAEQGKFWETHAALLEGQQSLAANAENGFAQYAKNLGLDAPTFRACLDADAALERVKADKQEAGRLGVNSTPTLFLGRIRPDGGVDLVRRMKGALPAETFAAEVAKLTQG